MTDDAPRLDLQAKRELGEAAGELLADKAFSAALLSLRKQWFGELMLDSIKPERQLELVAMLKALEMVPGQLQTMITDYKIAARRAASREGQAHG